MCGIFGAIGDYDKDKLKILAILNENRGRDSFGLYRRDFYKKKGLIYKTVDTPTMVLDNPKLNRYMKNSKGIFLGHTRFATKGDAIAKNSHPFQYGNVIGTHNGIIYNVEELGLEYTDSNFEVDSQVIFYLLNKERDFKSVFEKLDGYWGLAWTDKRYPKQILLSSHNQGVYYVKIQNRAIYYSSDENHLKLITGNRGDSEILRVPDNQVIRITESLNIKLGAIYKAKEKKPVKAEIYKPTWCNDDDFAITTRISGSNLYTYSDDKIDADNNYTTECCTFCGKDFFLEELYYAGEFQLCGECATKYAKTYEASGLEIYMYDYYGVKVNYKEELK